jgi:hypothetical protein
MVRESGDGDDLGEQFGDELSTLPNVIDAPPLLVTANPIMVATVITALGSTVLRQPAHWASSRQSSRRQRADHSHIRVAF